uniref:FAM3 metabolism regulating signaling molecule D n=1 Tax=Fundulus heteroclitus TaxID=8078 RepID=A0A3Q2TAT3_FUNHE
MKFSQNSQQVRQRFSFCYWLCPQVILCSICIKRTKLFFFMSDLHFKAPLKPHQSASSPQFVPRTTFLLKFRVELLMSSGQKSASMVKSMYKRGWRLPCRTSKSCGPAVKINFHLCLNSIMSHVLNNVGPGLNIVVVNGENGVVEKFGYLNMISGNSADILAYLKMIKPGMIVLVASFDTAATKRTDEIRQIFVEMGSTLIGSVKHRDNWVFAGRAGIKIKSFFEQRAENDKRTNPFDGWPEMVEVGGCFPRTAGV